MKFWDKIILFTFWELFGLILIINVGGNALSYIVVKTLLGV